MNDNLDRLNMQLGFAEWAEPRGYDMSRSDDGSRFVSLETNSAWLGYEAAHGPAGCGPKGQQIYAKIKKTSDYAHQTDQLFPVSVGEPPYSNYCVHGGPGGVYRLNDVSFYVIDNGKQYRLK